MLNAKMAPVPGTGGRLLAPGGDLTHVPAMDRAEAGHILRGNPFLTASPLVPEDPMPRFPSSLKSPLEGVPLSSWLRLVAALEVQPMGAVSYRGFGSYDLTPLRLADLGIVTLGRGRAVTICRFVLPWTKEAFLADPRAQLDALGQSLRRYQDDLAAGRIHRPKGVSLAGALALLHCGPGALSAWPNLFPRTRTVYERAQGAF